MECPICGDLFVSSVHALLLPCLHTICAQCMHDLVADAQEKNLETPSCLCCNEHFNPNELANNVTLFALNRSNPNNEDTMCDECVDSEPATHFCVTCAQHHCTRHHEAHCRSKKTHNHEHMPLLLKQTAKTTCSVHPNDAIATTACIDCNQPICLLCVGSTNTQHADHSCLKLEQAYKTYNHAFRADIDFLQSLEPLIDATYAYLDATSAAAINRLSDVVNKIHSTFDPVIQLLQQRRDSLLVAARAETDSDLKTLKLARDNMDTVKDAFVMACWQTNSLLSSQADFQDSDAINMYCTVAKRIKQLRATQIEPTPVVLNPLCFARPAVLPNIVVEKFGHVRRMLNYSIDPFPLLTMGTAGRHYSQLLHPLGLKVNRDGNFVIADNSNKRLLIWSPDGTHIRTITLRDIHPADVVETSTGDFWVADPFEHRLILVDGDGIVIRQIDLDEPRSVDVTENGDIVASGCGSVRCFSSLEGTERWSFSSAQESVFASVAVSWNGDVYVAAFSENIVIVLSSTDGRFLRQIGADILHCPAGIALTPDGCLVVTECPNADDQNNLHRVSVWSTSSAELLCVIGGEKSAQPGLFNRPRAVAVTEDNTIAVLETANCRIQIFPLA